MVGRRPGGSRERTRRDPRRKGPKDRVGTRELDYEV